MKKNILILLAFIFSITSFAQKIFQPGNYSVKTGETVSGLIKIISDVEIEFKTDEKSKSKIINANNINGYTITEPFKKYTSLKLDGDVTQFYAFIIESDISLLEQNKVYYIHNKTNGLRKLEVIVTEKSTDQGLFESTINSYIGVLSFYSKDCNSVRTKVNFVKYRRKSLSDYVIKLNECNDSEVNDYTIDKSVVNLFGIGVSVAGNYANFENRQETQTFETTDSSLGLGFGAFVSFSPNITKYNLSFILGLEYNQKKAEEVINTVNIPGTRIISHDASVLEPYLSVIYQPFYNKKWVISPYLGLGTSYGFTLSHKVKDEYELFIETREFDREYDQSFSVAFRIGAFVNIKGQSFLIEAVMSDYPYKFSNYGSNFQIKVGYIFNLK